MEPTPPPDDRDHERDDRARDDHDEATPDAASVDAGAPPERDGWIEDPESVG